MRTTSRVMAVLLWFTCIAFSVAWAILPSTVSYCFCGHHKKSDCTSIRRSGVYAATGLCNIPRVQIRNAILINRLGGRDALASEPLDRQVKVARNEIHTPHPRRTVQRPAEVEQSLLLIRIWKISDRLNPLLHRDFLYIVDCYIGKPVLLNAKSRERKQHELRQGTRRPRA
jgi:hypothetical protein